MSDRDYQHKHSYHKTLLIIYNYHYIKLYTEEMFVQTHT